ncbi:MAG: hypothetical protein AAFR17_08685 [Pseudomonadota bacterium]
MLDASQLSIAISAVLAGAIVLGWILHWLWVRAHRHSGSDLARVQEMVTRLHRADQLREQAEEARQRAEHLLSSREAEMTTRMQAMQHRMDGAVEGREADLSQSLREAQADASAAMDGLGLARRRIAELEAALEDTGGEGRVAALESELEQQTEAVARLSADLTETTDTLARTRDRLDQVTAALAEAQEGGATEESAAAAARRRSQRKPTANGQTKPAMRNGTKPAPATRKKTPPGSGGKPPR